MEWFRWYHGSVDDPKFGLVAKSTGASVAEVIAVWASVLESASASGERGVADGIDPEALDFRLGLDDGKADKILAAFVNRRMILSDGTVCKWEKRQPKREDPGAAERMRNYRERKKSDASLRTVTQSSTEERRGEEKREEKKNTRTESEQQTLPAVPERAVPAPTARGSVPRETWLTEYDEAWSVGKIPYGQAGKVFGALEKEHGRDATLAAWRAYCRDMESQPQFFSLAKFQTTFGAWANRSAGSSGSLPYLDEMERQGFFDPPKAVNA